MERKKKTVRIMQCNDRIFLSAHQLSLSLSLSLSLVLKGRCDPSPSNSILFSHPKMAAEAVLVRRSISSASFGSKWRTPQPHKFEVSRCTVCACSSVDGRNKFYKELGLFALKKKIEDAVQRTEMMAPTALQIEEARWVKLDGLIRDYDLWDDPAKTNDALVKLADIASAVDALRDLTYKAEEAKLITQLAEMDAINYALFEQAYTASLDMGKFFDRYEMLKLLKGPYDVDGASMVIKAESNGNYHELWAEKLLRMYQKWAEKQGYRGRIVEKRLAKNGGITSATVEFEFDYAYGYLQGEMGVHRLIRSSETGSTIDEVSLAAVDIIPLFHGSAPDLQINEEDLLILCPPSSPGVEASEGWSGVVIQHVPTGFAVQSSSERSIFANKTKALNRLKARLLVTASDKGVPDISGIKKEDMFDVWQDEARRYVLYPHKHVKDVRSGVEIPDLCSVLDGNIEPLIGAHIHMRRSNDMAR
ncbi:peptide chain release factor PrfB3, chloroplastic [Rhodamnia argentea]|uniref:Peptide chain release factor PrfB3, chloroplastic n=1 Tax=Rhodamnia argentea TaxID=178133 RepID=A0A8B8NU42_9MYRT|nr:peptide chain release factor PrfB3, chloroplastic [Rhodamnia argentea]